MADALVVLDHGASPAQALMAAQAACPQAPSLLAEAMVDTQSDEESLYEARLLVKSLRERDMEQEIRQAKARMREGSGLSPEELDSLFEKTVSLQKELAQLRNEASNEQGH